MFHPLDFRRATNFENANHGNNKRFDESEKHKDSFDGQESVYRENRSFLRDDSRGLHNMKHQTSPNSDGIGVQDNPEETQIL